MIVADEAARKLESIALKAQATLEAVAEELRLPAWAQRSRDALAEDLERANMEINQVRLALYVGLTVGRTLVDGGPDFEDSAEWDEMPAICGGSPEAYEPTTVEWEQLDDAYAEPEIYDFDDHVEQIGDGYVFGGALCEDDVRIATGTY